MYSHDRNFRFVGAFYVNEMGGVSGWVGEFGRLVGWVGLVDWLGGWVGAWCRLAGRLVG